MTEKEETVFISSTTAKRLIRDVKNILKEPLTEHGIYYSHSQDDILKGYALIIGPKDTVYEDGCYLFEFNFTTSYPFSPPIVQI